MMYEKWLEWDEWIYKQHKIYDQEQQQQDLIEGLHLIDICLKKEHHTNVFPIATHFSSKIFTLNKFHDVRNSYLRQIVFILLQNCIFVDIGSFPRAI